MNALEKLRTAARNMAKGRNLENHEECNLLLFIANEIESELAENYMELPKDADGVPVHVGDLITLPRGEETTVQFVAPDCVLPVSPVSYYMAVGCRHVKPDPLKELLKEMLDRNGDGVGYREFDFDFESFVDAYAERIRELTGADDR